MANKWMKALQKMEGAVDRDYNPYNHVLRTESPSVNFIYANSHGLPEGQTALLSGLPKAGKSLLISAYVAHLHKNDPCAIALKYNTEFREQLQMTKDQMKKWGIDPDRYMAFETNDPKEIFNQIANDINALCSEVVDCDTCGGKHGAKIKLIAIDSMNGIVGLRASDSEDISEIQRGDEAQTIGLGLKRILPVIRRHHIAMIMTTQVRAEQDPMKAKYNPHKMAAAFALKHFAEYFIMVSRNNSAEGKKDIAGNAFEDASMKDFMDKSEQTGHKIRIVMVESSVGVPGRTAEITFDYDKGIINVHEELFKLATKRGVVPLVGKSYVVKDFPTAGEEQKYIGKENFALAIRDNEFLAAELERRIRKIDADAMSIGRSNLPSELDMTDGDEVVAEE
jgi:RecA/RadA recombinase